MRVNLLVEGLVDEAVGRALLTATGHDIGVTFGKKGWTYIAQKATALDRTCGVNGLLTLVDFMDAKLECPVSIIQAWLPHRNPRHLFRVVVREIESWLLADRETIATFLCVPLQKIPLHPETLPDPKLALINLARTSRSKAIRTALVPQGGYSASEGPLYSSEMIRYVGDTWNPQIAAVNSTSLQTCLTRLMQLNGAV